MTRDVRPRDDPAREEWPGLGLAALGLAPAAARAASTRSLDTTLNLVAYSTPKPVMAKIISDFQATPAGQGVNFSQSYGASTSQAKAVIAGQPADIVFLSTGDDVNLLVDANLVERELGPPGLQRHRRRHGRRLRAPRRQPEEDQGLGRPDQAGRRRWSRRTRSARARRSGTSSPPTARSAISGRPTPRRSPTSQKLFKNVVSQDTSGSNATNTFLSGQGRRPDHLRERGDQRPPPGQEHPVRHPAPDDADRAPDRGPAGKPEQGPREQVHPVRQVRARAGGLRPVRLPPGRTSRRRRRSPSSSRCGPGQFTINDKTIGGWRAADKKWFDPSNGLMVKIEQAVGGPNCLAAAVAAPAARGGIDTRKLSERAGAALSLGFVTTFICGRRRAADRGARLGVGEARRRELLGRGHEPGGGGGAQADASRSPRSRPRSTRCSGRSPRGCSSGTTSAASRS